MDQPQDQGGWTTTAPTYSSSVARGTTVAAERIVTMANALCPVTSTSRILDNGAGTGTVTLTAAANFPNTPILATDSSSAMLEVIAAHKLSNVTTQAVDARRLTSEFPAGSFSHVFSTFVLSFITTPRDAIREMAAVLAPGGVIAIGLWALRNDPYDIWAKSCQAVDPAHPYPHQPFTDPHAWRTQGELEAVLADFGFTNLQTEEAVLPFDFPTAEAYCDFWFGAKNPGATLVISRWKGDLEPVKAAMLDVLRRDYNNGRDVKFWAVLGVGKKSS